MNIRKRTWNYNGKKSTAWLVDWNDRSGRHRQQFATKLEAEHFRDKLIRDRYAKEYGVLLEASFSEFLKIYEAKKPWRTESYRERVMRALIESRATLSEQEGYRAIHRIRLGASGSDVGG